MLLLPRWTGGGGGGGRGAGGRRPGLWWGLGVWVWVGLVRRATARRRRAASVSHAKRNLIARAVWTRPPSLSPPFPPPAMQATVQTKHPPENMGSPPSLSPAGALAPPTTLAANPRPTTAAAGATARPVNVKSGRVTDPAAAGDARAATARGRETRVAVRSAKASIGGEWVDAGGKSSVRVCRRTLQSSRPLTRRGWRKKRATL